MLSVYVWGNNANKVVAPSKASAAVYEPTELPALEGTAWRDVQLDDTSAVGIDAAGDVVQWGAGFDPSAPTTPVKTYTALDLVKIQLVGPKMYALSRSGHVYVLATPRANQERETSKLLGTRYQYVRLEADTTFHDIAAGDHHVLALSRGGQVYAAPADLHANDYGQLGYSAVALTTNDGARRRTDTRLEPRVVKKSERAAVQSDGAAPPVSAVSPVDEASLDFAPCLRAVPSLRGATISRIAAGSDHSVALTQDGRVLAWGRNSHGQLGLGARVTFDTIAVPTEVVMPTSLVGARATCTDIAAGGANTLFVVAGDGAPAQTEPGARPAAPQRRIDVLAVGAGQRGTLGHGQRNQACGVPVRVKQVSGLLEYSEAAGGLRPIGVHAVSVSRGGQCALVMDAPAVQSTETRRDVYVWGSNECGQLGVKKKSHAAAPMLLTLAGRQDEDADVTLDRVLLVEQSPGSGAAFRAAPRWLRGVEQRIVAGGSCMLIYTGVCM